MNQKNVDCSIDFLTKVKYIIKKTTPAKAIQIFLGIVCIRFFGDAFVSDSLLSRYSSYASFISSSSSRYLAFVSFTFYKQVSSPAHIH
ncbi:hypothetical protein KY326_03865, partial [Candidatus Woesearchaeota archaeon]|nr:hypothetical protein [Candidatus Woesearchaeota archaeon]